MTLNPLAVRWLPFVIHPSEIERDRPDPELVELALPDGESDWIAAMQNGTAKTVQIWSIDAVLRNLAYQAAAWHIKASERSSQSPKRKPQATLDQMRHWIMSTRSLAARLPYSGHTRERMLDAAAALEANLSWPAKYFTSYPTSVGTKADADWRVSLSLYALDRLLRAVNETEKAWALRREERPLEYLSLPPTKFWPAMFNWYPTTLKEPVFSDYKEADKRVSRFRKPIKPGGEDALMRAILSEALRIGPFGPDGQRRTRPIAR